MYIRMHVCKYTLSLLEDLETMTLLLMKPRAQHLGCKYCSAPKGNKIPWGNGLFKGWVKYRLSMDYLIVLENK